MKTVNVDVFVVGAGPTGLACAALLAKQGVQVLAITRYPGLANSPRAHIINQRTMEVFRDLGIESRVIDAAMPGKLMGRVVWATSFAGTELARRSAWGAGADRLSDYAEASPSDLCNVHQHILEPIMCEAAWEFGAQIRFDLELVSMREDGEHVRSTCRDRQTGETVEVVSRYAVGADGDNSVVCRELGFELEGKMDIGHMVNYWIEADLTKYTARRLGAQYQILQPGGRFWAGTAVFVNVRPWNEWVMSMPYDPALGDPDRGAEAAAAHARRFVGDPDLKVRLISASTWTINQVYAKAMRKGRVVIAGNAAHRHPPAGGLGANTCIQDAFNLCWKLALMLQGRAGDSLLDTYSDERQPVAKQIVLRANRSLETLFEMAAASGLRPGQTEEEGWASIRETFADTAEGAQRRVRLLEALKLQDFNFNALGVEMGQMYASAAVVSDGAVKQSVRDPELFHHPRTTPGAPLPHAWVSRGGRDVSTLDVVGRGRFTLVTGIGGQRWREAAAELSGRFSIPLDAVTIGPGAEVEDVYGEWALRREIGEAGCLLIRPDRHIAYRSMEMIDHPREVLASVLEQILCAA